MEFFILDLDIKVEVLLILGRPILPTFQALIDAKDSRMILRVGNEEVVFKIQDAMRHSIDFDDTC